MIDCDEIEDRLDAIDIQFSRMAGQMRTKKLQMLSAGAINAEQAAQIEDAADALVAHIQDITVGIDDALAKELVGPLAEVEEAMSALSSSMLPSETASFLTAAAAVLAAATAVAAFVALPTPLTAAAAVAAIRTAAT